MARIGGIHAGPGHPVRIMGVINASPESYYKESVCSTKQDVMDRAKSIEDEGGDYVDIGGMSTAPYANTEVSEPEETTRVLAAINAAQDACNLPISVDTSRASTAKAALEAGARIINDVSGLQHDAAMAETVKLHGASVVLGAYGGPAHVETGNKINAICMAGELLHKSLLVASASGILAADGIALDPLVGFFRSDGMGKLYTRIAKEGDEDWVSRDVDVLSSLYMIRDMVVVATMTKTVMTGSKPIYEYEDVKSVPIMVSVSNKSFLGRITGRDDIAQRVYGSIAAEAIAIVNGADIIRTHNVAAARDAAAVAYRLYPEED